MDRRRDNALGAGIRLQYSRRKGAHESRQHIAATQSDYVLSKHIGATVLPVGLLLDSVKLCLYCLWLNIAVDDGVLGN